MTTTSLRYDDVNVGDQLPELDIPLTRTLIVSTAIASRDYQDVHHDPGLAQERGSPDIFMTILTTHGLVGRYVTDWAGPNALLKAVRIRLGAPTYPGDTMKITGAVTRKDELQRAAAAAALELGAAPAAAARSGTEPAGLLVRHARPAGGRGAARRRHVRLTPARSPGKAAGVAQIRRPTARPRARRRHRHAGQLRIGLSGHQPGRSARIDQPGAAWRRDAVCTAAANGLLPNHRGR